MRFFLFSSSLVSSCIVYIHNIQTFIPNGSTWDGFRNAARKMKEKKKNENSELLSFTFMLSAIGKIAASLIITHSYFIIIDRQQLCVYILWMAIIVLKTTDYRFKLTICMNNEIWIPFTRILTKRILLDIKSFMKYAFFTNRWGPKKTEKSIN